MSGRVGTLGQQAAANFAPDPLLRYRERVLASADLQDRVKRAGFAVVDPVFPPASLRELDGLARAFLDRLSEPYGDLFLAAGRIADAELRTEIADACGAIVRPHLEPLFLDHIDVFSATLQVKPPSPASALNPHQDASLLDEAHRLGLYCWIPLVDVDEHNGWLQVIPGSHRLGNAQRTLNIPWQFRGQESVFAPHLVGLPMRAGSVCLFDAATVHASPPNRSSDIRFALNNFAKPCDAPMVHFLADESTSPGCVETWIIDERFYLTEDFMVRPGAAYQSVGERPAITVDLTDAQLDATLRQLAQVASHFD